ncbi:MAG: hypothetical protein M3295_06620 [Chloroflexota bacterium]|nr:hypothetical protein [Chloroflexota bacterium]
MNRFDAHGRASAANDNYTDADGRLLLARERMAALRHAALDARQGRAARRPVTHGALAVTAVVGPRAGVAWRSARLWLAGRLVTAGQSLTGATEQPCD